MKNMRERFYLIDIIKLVSIMSIILLHSTEFIFYSDINPIITKTFFYKWIEHFSRYIPFSGQTIVFTIFFIWGITKKRFSSHFKFITILLFIHFLMVLPFWGEETFLESIEWDIYPFLIVSYLTVIFLDRFPKFTILYVIISFTALWIPTSLYSKAEIPFLIRGALIGNCSLSLSGSWPIVPWIFLPIFGYFFSQIVKTKKEISKQELSAWAIILMLGTTQFGKMYDVLMGPGFYCYILNLDPVVFWGNFIFIIFLFRLAVLDRVQSFFRDHPKLTILSSLAWNKYFGLCYMTQIIFLVIAANFRFIFQKPIYFDLLLVSLFPLTEFTVRYLTKYLRLQKIESIK